ncbi:expressed unknown protein [Seminavis robusta]|uniref:Uncharacterized protein n=1 Tax=Seminavis robusta TaxID=568900 RepID=A0A9N8DQ94_9STRA|nr:expressed unknown protein [Seminavis robusta]|eukprot:Sro275_g105660.1 n/a (250) ;mRNA; f:19168-19917
MDPMDEIFGGWDGFYGNEDMYLYSHWRSCSEKSDAAKAREGEATGKFEELRKKVERAMINNKVHLVHLGCKAGSESLFESLPTVSIDHILDFVRVKPVPHDSNSTSTSTRPAAAARRQPAAAAASLEDDDDEELDLDQLYIPGNKIEAKNLIKPNCHLTGPSWRDFSRAVRAHEGWNVKRRVATAAQKKAYKETRQGKVYFIDAIYTVPGGAAPKKKKASTKTMAVDAKLPAKKKQKKTHKKKETQKKE